MMKENRKPGKVISGLLVLMLALTGIVSCGKDEAPPEKSTVVSTNPYSSDSVFLETKKKLRENPNDVDALYHLADLYDRNGQYKEAIEAYGKVVKLKPDMGYAYYKIGTAYDRLNRHAEAVNAFKKTIKYMPGYAPLYNNMGVAYGKLGKTGEAIAALQKAIKLRTRYSAARFNLGMTYLKTGNRKAALQQYESLKDMDSGIADALMKEIKGNS